MPARLFLSSGDLIADRRYEFARDLQLKGDLAAAADLLEQAMELAPNFASAWFTLGEIRRAARRARGRDRGVPQGARGRSRRSPWRPLYLMQLGAEEISAMPSAYVQTLFDQYAPRFEVRAGRRSRLSRPGAVVQGGAVGARAPRRSRPSSSARSISAAARGLRPLPLPAMSTASSASTCRRG